MLDKFKSYLYVISNPDEWNDFKKSYKNKGLGNNLQEAITTLIERENKR